MRAFQASALQYLWHLVADDSTLTVASGARMIDDSTMTVIGGTWTVDGGTLMVTDGTWTIDGGTLTIANNTQTIDDNTLTVGGGTQTSDDQHRLDSSVAGTTQSRHHQAKQHPQDEDWILHATRGRVGFNKDHIRHVQIREESLYLLTLLFYRYLYADLTRCHVSMVIGSATAKSPQQRHR
jgi:hypothetical protein